MDYTTLTRSSAEMAAFERNKVLRNTYALLALTMLPTAVGAYLGIAMQFAMRPLFGVLLFLGVAFGSFYAIEKTKNSPIGVLILLGFTGFMGLWLSQILQVALRFGNGGEMIGMAAIGTAAIFFTMAGIATVTKKDFSFLGKFLLIGAIIAILASVANIFFQIPVLSLAISAVVLLIFSVYILFDVSRIVNGGETNYISATLALYMDIYNVFVSLLNILMMLTGRRD